MIEFLRQLHICSTWWSSKVLSATLRSYKLQVNKVKYEFTFTENFRVKLIDNRSNKLIYQLNFSWLH